MNANGDLAHLTIITVCRNAERFLDRAFSSVASQRLDGIRLDYLVVDGDSTDRTVEIIRKWTQAGLVTRWISEPDNGIYDAMNKAIGLGVEGHVLFLNADDQLSENSLERVAGLIAAGVDYLYGDAEIVSQDGPMWIQYGNPLELLRFVLCNHQSLWVKAAWLTKLGGFDETTGIAADLDFMWRLYLSGAKGVYIPGTIARFHQGGASGSGYDDSVMEVQHRYAGAMREWCSRSPDARANFLLGWSERLRSLGNQVPIARDSSTVARLMSIGSEVIDARLLDPVEKVLICLLNRPLSPSLAFASSLLRRWERFKLRRMPWIVGCRITSIPRNLYC